jgi:hypothetical protein
MDPYEMILGFKPPQNFFYLDGSTLSKIMEKSKMSKNFSFGEDMPMNNYQQNLIISYLDR